jgi:hypothetical protein
VQKRARHHPGAFCAAAASSPFFSLLARLELGANTGEVNMKPVVDPSRIRDRAYARWQERGCPEGTAEQDWFEAERELRERLAAEAPQPPAPALRPPAPSAARAPVTLPASLATPRLRPPRPTLKRTPSARTARLGNEVTPKAPPASRTQIALAAAAAAYMKRSAVGSS